MGDAFGFVVIVMIVMALALLSAVLFITGVIFLILFSIRDQKGNLKKKSLFAIPISLLVLSIVFLIPLILCLSVIHS